MSPRARLIAGCLIAVAGGVVILVALRSDWRVVVTEGTRVPVPGGGSASVGGTRTPVPGSEVVGWLVPVALSIAALPALALTQARRARAVMLAVAALGALLVMGGVIAAPAAGVDSTSPRIVEPTGGPGAAFAGAAVALAGVWLAAKPAATVPKLGLPERPPSEEAGP